MLLALMGQVSSDVTAPILSLPTGTATSDTTASGTVTTDEGNGLLYYWATENASETAADIKTNGESQAVSASGVQNVTVSGLTESTSFYLHYVHEDDATNQSNVVSSAAFETDSATAAEPPTRELGEDGGALAGRQRKRKKMRERDDQDLTDIIMLALPDILDHINKR